MIKIDLSTLIARQLSNSSRAADNFSSHGHKNTVDIDDSISWDEESLRNTRIRFNSIGGRLEPNMTGVIKASQFKGTYEVDSFNIPHYQVKKLPSIQQHEMS